MSVDLEAWDAWLTSKAAWIAGPRRDRIDDLKQEGRVAIWKAAGSFDPKRGSWASLATTAAMRRMRECHNHDRWTGSPDRTGRREKDPITSALFYDSTLDEEDHPRVTLGEDRLVEHIDAERALASLDPSRAWWAGGILQGVTQAALARAAGISQQGAQYHRRRAAKQMLAMIQEVA